MTNANQSMTEAACNIENAKDYERRALAAFYDGKEHAAAERYRASCAEFLGAVVRLLRA